MAIEVDLEVLRGAGLTNAEALVYVSLLELGSSTSGKVLNKTGIQNSVLHRALNSLIQKGLVSFIIEGKNRLYHPEPAKQLLALIEEKQKSIEKILPELEKRALVNEANYSAEMFLGKRAVFSAHLGMINDSNPKEEYLSFSMIAPHEDKDVADFFQKFFLIRKEKKVIVKLLANIKAKAIWDLQYTKAQFKYLRPRYTNFEFPQGVAIFRNRVLLVQWASQPSAVKITNKEMADNFRNFFYAFYTVEKDPY